MDLGIAGRTALVLGAGGGLGGAIAEALAAEGVQVVAAGRDTDATAATVRRIVDAGGRAWATPTWDLADLDLVPERVAEIEERQGGVDILVNNTGGPPPGPLVGRPREVWQDSFTAMVMSVVTLTDRVLPGMIERRWGRIVTSTSSGVVAPIPGLGLSNALRMSLLGWSKTVAGEVAAHGVTANVVVPGRIATARVRSLDEARAAREGREVDEVQASSIATIPVGRYGDPREYAAAVAFLASEPAGYITGSVLRVDGGYIPAT